MKAKGGVMPDIIVKPEESGTFAAFQNAQVVARGETQLEAAEKAHGLRPNDHILAARIRPQNAGLDKFRHLFGPKRRGR
jgi:hypothetical protein